MLAYATSLYKLHESNKYKYYKQLFTEGLENKDIRYIHLKERKEKLVFLIKVK